MKIKLLFLLLVLSTIKSSAQCSNVPANSGSTNLTYTFSGGSFQSYGCAPIDPTYWIAGSGPSVTVTFSTPQDYPRFRVWGMNTDDVASMMVNNVSYSLNATSATILPKVVCGISPGPDGVAFSNGNLMGANTPQQGNYSYNDIQLTTTGVTSFKITGISGAGWGFASTLLFCEPLANTEFDWNTSVSIYSKSNELHLDISEELIDSNAIIYDVLGKEIKNFKLNATSTIHYLNRGIYLIKIEKDGSVFTKKTIVN
jgi:hypothetical protein